MDDTILRLRSLKTKSIIIVVIVAPLIGGGSSFAFALAQESYVPLTLVLSSLGMSSFKIASIAALTPPSSSSTVAPGKIALHPTYVGFDVLRAKILATRVARSILLGTGKRAVLKTSEGLRRCRCILVRCPEGFSEEGRVAHIRHGIDKGPQSTGSTWG